MFMDEASQKESPSCSNLEGCRLWQSYKEMPIPEWRELGLCLSWYVYIYPAELRTSRKVLKTLSIGHAIIINRLSAVKNLGPPCWNVRFWRLGAKIQLLKVLHKNLGFTPRRRRPKRTKMASTKPCCHQVQDDERSLTRDIELSLNSWRPATTVKGWYKEHYMVSNKCMPV